MQEELHSVDGRVVAFKLANQAIVGRTGGPSQNGHEASAPNHSQQDRVLRIHWTMIRILQLPIRTASSNLGGKFGGSPTGFGKHGTNLTLQFIRRLHLKKDRRPTLSSRLSQLQDFELYLDIEVPLDRL